MTILTEAKLRKFISTLFNMNYRVIAPIHEDDRILLRPITRSDQWIHTYKKSQNSVKDFLLPMREELFQFTTEGDIHELPLDKQPTIFFGVRPCDAQAIQRLDSVFTSTPKDQYYISKRQTSILIGLACNTPDNSCFCTSVGGGPHNPQGLDLLLIQLDNTFLLEPISETGHQLVEHASLITSHPTSEQLQHAKQMKQQAETQIIRRLDTIDLLTQLTNKFNSEYWKEEAYLCISCGICTFLCPTCHCFNIVDEDMTRVKFWDSCQFATYTKHANGHNPRNHIYQRLRNRILHKFLYFPQNFNQYLCVGCGRCNQYCPMRLDLINLVSHT